MNNLIKRAFGLVGSLAVIVLFQNCGSESKIQFGDAYASSRDYRNSDTKTLNFSVDTKPQDIDIIWTFDNSGSMQEEADSVERNFQNFVSSLNTMFNVNVALINRVKTAAYDRNNVALPASMGEGNVQVDYFVDSYNAMLVTAASTCPAVPSADDSFCIQVQNQARYARVYGSLNSFLRPHSKKVFVFVTDDDSAGPTGRPQYDRYPVLSAGAASGSISLTENVDYIKESTFRERMTRALGADGVYKAFAFVSFDRRTLSPCGYKEGKEYISLVNGVGGQAFNICEADWSEHFRKLTESITEFAQHEFSLTAAGDFKSVLSVSINGAVIAPTRYSVRSGTLVLDPALVASLGTYDIHVEFEQYLNEP